MKPWLEDSFVEQSTIMLDSFRRFLGRELMERSGDPLLDAKRLYEVPFIVLAHENGEDPLLTYANKAAQELMEFDWETMLTIPSRLTAEPIHRQERANLLARTKEKNFTGNYQGIRVSLNGRKFQIEGATTWNLVDLKGKPSGQAATFTQWEYLPVK